MEQQLTVFALFGGIRPMARVLSEAPSNVAAWKRVGRIPAEKQPHVLTIGLALGLPITAEHVVFPLGRETSADGEGLPASDLAVACDRSSKLQRKDVG